MTAVNSTIVKQLSMQLVVYDERGRRTREDEEQTNEGRKRTRAKGKRKGRKKKTRYIEKALD